MRPDQHPGTCPFCDEPATVETKRYYADEQSTPVKVHQVYVCHTKTDCPNYVPPPRRIGF